MLKPISEIAPYVPFGKSKTTQLLKNMIKSVSIQKLDVTRNSSSAPSGGGEEGGGNEGGNDGGDEAPDPTV